MPLPLSDMKRLEYYLELSRDCLLPNSWLYVRLNYLETSLDPLMGTNSITDIQGWLDELDAIDTQLIAQQTGSGLAQEIDITGEYSIKFQDGVNTYTALRGQKEQLIGRICKVLNISTSKVYQGKTTRG